MRRSMGRLVAASAATLVGAAAPCALATYTYTFDNAGSFTSGSPNYNPSEPNFRFDYGGATPTATHSISFSSNNQLNPSPAASGSVELSQNFSYTNDGAESSAFTIDLFPSPSPTNITNIAFDVMVQSNSATDTSGGAGYFQVFVRDDNYDFPASDSYHEELGNPSYSSPTIGTWEHISFPLTGSSENVRALTLQLYNDSGRDINGTVNYDIDNLVLTTPAVPEPASLGLLGLAAGSVLVRRRKDVASVVRE